MRWIGQHIWPFKSRFRSDAIVENDASLYMGTSEILSNSGTTTSLANIDSVDATTAGSIQTALVTAGYGGDITSVVAGSGMTGGATSGAATLNVIGGDGITANANDMAVTSTQTTITSITNDNLNIGYGEDAQITFAETGFTYTSSGAARLVVTDALWSPTHNHIDLGATDRRFKNIYVEEIIATNGSISGTLDGDVTIAANNNTNETCYPVFVDGATGSQGLESDTGLTYNPQDGNLTSTTFTGDLTGTATSAGTVTASAQPAIESIGTDGDTLAILADDINISNSTANKPIINITNTHAGAAAGELRFNKDSASGDDGDVMGTISWYGTDAAENTHQQLAYIDAQITDSAHGSEAATLRFYVAENDGTNTLGLSIQGQPDDDGEVDVEIGAGAGSVVTIPGQLLAVNGGMGARHYGTTIKILPSDFIQDEGGGVNKSIQFDGVGTIGVRSSHVDANLWAFVPIPEGMKVTHTHIKGLDSGADGSSADDFPIYVYSYSLDDGSLTAPMSGAGVVGTNLNHGDIASTTTNCFAVKIDVADIAGSDTDVVYGGYLTIAQI